jgi:glutathione S-transferase
MTTRLWLIRAISIHEAINTMSFATVQWQRVQSLPPEAIDAELVRLPNPQVAAKRRDIYAQGVHSVFVGGALRVLTIMFRDMQIALESGPWLTGERYGLADTTLIAYVDRLERLGLKGLWAERFPKVDPWLRASQARPSYATAIAAFLPPAVVEGMRSAGEAAWPEISRRLG